MTRSLIKQEAKKAAAQSSWTPSLCVSKADARGNLASLLKHVAKGKPVYVGASKKAACSKFVSVSLYQTKYADPKRAPSKIAADRLRKVWNREREAVENSGRPLEITRNGIARAVLIPTDFALRTKVHKNQANLALGEDDKFQALKTDVSKLSKDLQKVAALFDGITNESLRQMLGLIRVVIKEWRTSQGLTGELPLQDTV